MFFVFHCAVYTSRKGIPEHSYNRNGVNPAETLISVRKQINDAGLGGVIRFLRMGGMGFIGLISRRWPVRMRHR